MKVAICLIVKNERADIADWVAYYTLLGADALIVFDNGSTDGTHDVLRAAGSLFDVRVIHWPRTDRRAQLDAYEHACRVGRDEFDWIGCFDADEYLVLHRGRSLAALLDRPPECGAVALNWAMFGSSGHVDAPDAPAIQAFTRRSDESFFPNRHVKAFVRPGAVRACGNPHYFDVEGAYQDAAGRPVEWFYFEAGNYREHGLTQAAPDFSIAQVNHYFVRSRAHWLRKLARGYPDGIRPREESEFELYDQNQVEDHSAWALLEPMRARSAQIGMAATAAPPPVRPRRPGEGGPVVHVLTQGNMANQMIQLLVAVRLASLVPDCRISHVDLPDWGYHYPDLPPTGGPSVVVEGQYVDVRGLAARLRSGEIERVNLAAYGQHLANFPAREDCARIFPPAPGLGGYGPDKLVCNIRGGEVLDARHLDYTLLPARFYAELAERTGCTPVFMGQIEDNAYCHDLQRMFPEAEFRQSQGALADFQVFRNSATLVPAVSTFSWLAAWLSEAARIVLPVNGLFHPVQNPAADLLPLADPRYSFVLFPINYAVPVAQYRAAHAALDGQWRQMRPEAIAAMRSGPRWPRRVETAGPLLDEAFYLSTYPDVAAAVAAGGITALGHYYQHGHAEGRQAFRLDRHFYSTAYKMAAFEVGQGDFADLEHHYVEIGRARGYRPVP